MITKDFVPLYQVVKPSRSWKSHEGAGIPARNIGRRNQAPPVIDETSGKDVGGVVAPGDELLGLGDVTGLGGGLLGGVLAGGMAGLDGVVLDGAYEGAGSVGAAYDGAAAAGGDPAEGEPAVGQPAGGDDEAGEDEAAAADGMPNGTAGAGAAPATGRADGTA